MGARLISIRRGGLLGRNRRGALAVSWRPTILAALAAVQLAWALPATTAAHSPTEGKAEYSTDNHHQIYAYGTRSGSVAPSWLQTNVNAALNGDWDSANTTRSPYFSLPGGAAEIASVYWNTNAETPNTPECPASLWYACTDYLSSGQVEDRWKSTTFLKGTGPGSLESYWCQSTAQVGSTDGCFDTRRVALHEAGHAVGISRSSNGHVHFPGGAGANPDHSVMHSVPIAKPSTGYDQRWLGACDVLSLAIDYDLDSFDGVYPGCVDHLGAPAIQNDDIDTAITQNTTTLLLCVGQSFSFAGTAKIVTASVLGQLSANGLAGRTVTIYRRTPTGSFVAYTTASVVSGEGGAWSRTISFADEATFVFQARYTPDATDDPTLDGDSTGVEKTVTWDFAC